MASIFLFYLFSLGCSRIDLAINWADNYISRQIDHYFDMNSLQLQLLKKSLDEDLLKVREIIFPSLADRLQKMKVDVEGITIFKEGTIQSYEVEFRKIFDKGLIIFEPSAQVFVNSLTLSQVQSFKKEFDKKTTDLEYEANHPKEAKAKKYDDIINRLEEWIGALSSEQRNEVEKFNDVNVFPLREQILNREKISREFIESFPDKLKRKKFIHQLFYQYDSLREHSYARTIEEYQHKYFGLITVILNKMTNEQKKIISRKLNDRAEQVQKSSENSKNKKIKTETF